MELSFSTGIEVPALTEGCRNAITLCHSPPNPDANSALSSVSQTLDEGSNVVAKIFLSGMIAGMVMSSHIHIILKIHQVFEFSRSFQGVLGSEREAFAAAGVS
jgi:hypothetical protein